MPGFELDSFRLLSKNANRYIIGVLNEIKSLGGDGTAVVDTRRDKNLERRGKERPRRKSGGERRRSSEALSCRPFVSGWVLGYYRCYSVAGINSFIVNCFLLSVPFIAYSIRGGRLSRFNDLIHNSRFLTWKQKEGGPWLFFIPSPLFILPGSWLLNLRKLVTVLTVLHIPFGRPRAAPRRRRCVPSRPLPGPD